MSNQQVTNSQNKEKPVAWWRACFPTKKLSNGVRNPVSRNNSYTHAVKHNNYSNHSNSTTKIIAVDKVMGNRVVQDTPQVPIKQTHITNSKPTSVVTYSPSVSSSQQRAPGFPRTANLDQYIYALNQYTYVLNSLKSVEIESKNDEDETPSPQEPTNHKGHTEDILSHGRESPRKCTNYNEGFRDIVLDDDRHHHTSYHHTSYHRSPSPVYESHHTSSNDYGCSSSNDYGCSSSNDYGCSSSYSNNDNTY